MDLSLAAELPNGLARLLGQDVAFVRVTALEAAFPGAGKTLGSALVGFQLWHLGCSRKYCSMSKVFSRLHKP